MRQDHEDLISKTPISGHRRKPTPEEKEAELKAKKEKEDAMEAERVRKEVTEFQNDLLKQFRSGRINYEISKRYLEDSIGQFVEIKISGDIRDPSISVELIPIPLGLKKILGQLNNESVDPIHLGYLQEKIDAIRATHGIDRQVVFFKEDTGTNQEFRMMLQ